MSSPTFSDALSYVVDAQDEILSAVADWKSYADAAAEAYSQAYEDQGIVLGSVNKRLEEMRKEDAERMTLALTILTVGVAGPIASVLVKDKAAKVFEKLAENLQGKASKTALEAGEMVKDSAGDLTKKGLEKVAEEVSKAYERPSVEDAFHSSGVPPDQYGDQLQEAIDLQTGVLQKLITAFMRKGSAGMTMDEAKQLLTRILNTDFVKYPPSAVKKGVLRKKASVALWLVWAWDRDQEYWERHSLLFNAKELSAFEPVRRVLVDQLQFPGSAIRVDDGAACSHDQHDRIHQVVVWSGGAGGAVRRDADESARAPVCGDPDESKFAECDVQEAGDCPGG